MLTHQGMAKLEVQACPGYLHLCIITSPAWNRVRHSHYMQIEKVYLLQAIGEG